MRTLVILILSFAVWGAKAQTKPKQTAPFTIRGNVGIPRNISSRLFNTCFKGVVESNLSANARLFQDVYAGLGYQNTFFQNDKSIFRNQVTPKASVPYDTKLLMNSVFFKMGYDKFFSDIGYYSFAVNSGYTFAKYVGVLPDTSFRNQPYVAKDFSAPYLQPEFSVNFIAEEKLSFSLMLSYTTLFYRFDPKAPRMAHFQEVYSQVQAHHNKYVMSWFNFGFGFNVLIK
jgi:hypothetical protein